MPSLPEDDDARGEIRARTRDLFDDSIPATSAAFFTNDQQQKQRLPCDDPGCLIYDEAGRVPA